MSFISMDNYNPYNDILKDKRIKVESKTTVKDTIIISAKLIPDDNITCPICGSNILLKWGKSNRSIKETLYQGCQTIIKLEVQKFQCKTCNSFFRDSTSVLKQKERISLHTKLIVLKKLKEDVTLTHVAREVGISPQEVYNIFDEHIKIEKHKLPEVLCIDEFKNLKYVEGKYAVVLYDPINGIIIDVLESRLLSNLEDYFTRLDISDKKTCKILYFGYV